MRQLTILTSPLDHALPHWVYRGESVSYKRTKPKLFLRYFLTLNLLEWSDIRYARTKTLTRPDYISLVPLTRSNGRSPATMEWRNKRLTPGSSKNNDLSVSINNNKFGFFTVGYFDKTIKNLIYSSGSRILFEDDTTSLIYLANYVNYKIMNYELNNPYEILLSGLGV